MMKLEKVLALPAVLALGFACACGGGGGGSSSVTTSTGGTGGSGGGGSATNNVAPIVVDAGPANNSADEAFVTVSVCVPGTSSCTNIDHVQVDTGSAGLRVLSSQLTVALPQTFDANNNPVAECTQFVDMTFIWGPVMKADIKIAGESASSVPVQVINSNFQTIPQSCSTAGGKDVGNQQALGANGIIGVGLARVDCGTACSNTPPVSGAYYSCPAAGCQPFAESLATQVPNPVALFATDNNGVLIQFANTPPAAGQTQLAGSLIFGIGTQSNNAIGNATVLQVDSKGEISTQFNGKSFTSFIDSGSNGYFFLDANTTGMPLCTGNLNSFYCPTSPQQFNVTNVGTNNASKASTFTIERADVLFQGTNSAFTDLGGPQANSFDFGLPFFFGQNVFTAIAGQPTPAGPGPYVAY